MAIVKRYKVTISKDAQATTDYIYVYQHDRGVDLQFSIIDMRELGNGFRGDILKGLSDMYSTITIVKPDSSSFKSEKLPIVSGKVLFTITEELTDELTEIGMYTLQIHLHDIQDNRITIPEVQFEVKELISDLDCENTGAVAGYSRVGMTEVASEQVLFTFTRGYSKTTWATGDKITAVKLNNLEAGIETVTAEVEQLKASGGGTGTQGPKGDKGDTGATPNISIGSVVTLAPGQNATVTKTGTAEAPVLNFGIPKGDKGDTGTGGSGGTDPSSHTHPNKTILDEITSEKVNDWDGKATEAFVTNKIEEAQLGGGEGSYILPTASQTVKGGIKVGATLKIGQDGVLNVADEQINLPNIEEMVLMHPESPMEIETYDGQNQIVHQKVLYFKSGWNGYKFWMGYTPLPYKPSVREDLENPCIAVSNDGENWSTPEGLINPLDLPDAFPNDYMSDSHLVYIPTTNVLEIWYRQFVNSPIKEVLWRRTSKDGIMWTEPEKVIENVGTSNKIVSPSIIFDDNKYKIWMGAGNGIDYYESDNGLNPSFIKRISIAGAIFGHCDVIKSHRGYELIAHASGDQNIQYATSIDNISWSAAKTILTTNSNSWAKTKLYRPSLTIVDNQYYLYYTGGMGRTGNEGAKIGLIKIGDKISNSISADDVITNELNQFVNKTEKETIARMATNPKMLFMSQSEYNALSKLEEHTLYGIVAENKNVTQWIYNLGGFIPPEVEEYGNIVTDVSSLNIKKGYSSILKVKLDKSPTNNQVINISKSNSNITLTQNVLTFTSQNYDAYQEISVQAVGEVNTTSTVTLTSNGVPAKQVQITVISADSNVEDNITTRGLCAWNKITLEDGGSLPTSIPDVTGNDNTIILSSVNDTSKGDGFIGKALYVRTLTGEAKNYMGSSITNEWSLEVSYYKDRLGSPNARVITFSKERTNLNGAYIQNNVVRVNDATDNRVHQALGNGGIGYHHVVITYNNQKINIYDNGIKIVSDVSLSSSLLPKHLEIVKNGTLVYNNDFLLLSVKGYNVALTEEEIFINYEYEKQYDVLSIVPHTNIIADFKSTEGLTVTKWEDIINNAYFKLEGLTEANIVNGVTFNQDTQYGLFRSGVLKNNDSFTIRIKVKFLESLAARYVLDLTETFASTNKQLRVSSGEIDYFESSESKKTNSFELNTLHDIIVTFDASTNTIKYYINRVEVYSGTVTSLKWFNSIAIGRRVAESSHTSAKCTVDRLTLFNKTLSIEEINVLD